MTHRRLSSEEAARLDIDLWIGGHPWPGMTDEQALELLAEAWEQRRETLLAGRDSPGRRPVCWWVFDRLEAIPVGAAEVERLLELGELDDREMDEIVAAAEHQIERCGLAFRAHGQDPRIACGNVIRRFRGIPEWGLR